MKRLDELKPQCPCGEPIKIDKTQAYMCQCGRFLRVDLEQNRVEVLL